jgi:hypothetical protein
MADFIFKGVNEIRNVFGRMALKNRRKKTMRDVMIHSVQVGLRAAKAAAPVLTGHLRSNIQGKVEGHDEEVRGWLEVDLSVVPYARRQNFEHGAHARFMEIGSLAIQREAIKFWEDSNNVEDFVFNE